MIWLAWLVDAVFVFTYFLCAHDPKYIFEFNLANLIGGCFLVIYLATAGAWGILPLTASFTLIGGYGVFFGRR